MGKGTEDHPTTKVTMANLNDKTKAKAGDGQQMIATVDTKDRNKPLNILPAKLSPRIRAIPKEKENGKRMGKENHLVRKVKERAQGPRKRETGIPQCT
jgi:hypothetical protein